MAIPAAVIAGAQAVSGAASGFFGGKVQAEAAERAAGLSKNVGTRGANEIYDAQQLANQYAADGQQQALQQYALAQQFAEAQRAGLNQYYDQARQVGGSALARYQDAILNGNQGAVYQDPAFQFRQSQADSAAGTLAARAGLDPALMQQQHWGQYNQQLANEEYTNALARLQGLGALGSNARQAYAGADMRSLEAINRIRGAYGAEVMGGNQYLAQLNQNAAAAYANSLQNMASNTSNYEIQRANALANQAANFNNQLQDSGANMLYLYMRGRQQQPQQPQGPEQWEIAQ